ncbi:MAG: S8 family serine peptidase, partial [Halovenus sp.]
MTDPQDTEPDDDLPFNRREVLKTIGGAGTIGAFGTGTATGQPSKDFVVGTTHGRADIAKQKANSVKHKMDFGPEIGEAVAGRWPEEALKGLKNNPHVRYIEEDKPGERHVQTLPWGVDRIDAEVAHANGDTASGVDVAIIDSGIDSDHDDLEANLGTGHAPAKCSDCCSGCDEEWEDTDGHGTAVAGIVGAIDNTSDVVGVGPDITLHAIKDGD